MPKLNGVNARQQLDHNGLNQQSQASLPPLGPSLISGISAVNGQGLLNKQPNFQPYMVKPTKLRSIPKPLLVQSSNNNNGGINGEKINISKYGGGAASVAPVALHESFMPTAVSRANQLATLSVSNSGPTQIPSSQEPRKVYKKRSKPVPSVVGAVSLPPATRNGGSGLGEGGGGNTSMGAEQD